MIRDLGIAFSAGLFLAAVTAVVLGLRAYRRACRADPWNEPG